MGVLGSGKKKKHSHPEDNRPIKRPTELISRQGYFVGRFEAMASSCELLMDTDDPAPATRILRIASREAWRIEAKFSRYRKESVVCAINRGGGAGVRVDDETARLIDFAGLCHQLSGGLFDVTTGVLRRAWKFDGGDGVPPAQKVEALLPLVGWEKALWENRSISLPAGMEIDFGGLGREYAADRALALAMEEARGIPMVVNFGGDAAASGPRKSGQPWIVGVEDPCGAPGAARALMISGGGMATSGGSRRFLQKDGKRYGHILNPLTGWPVEGAAKSVTVAEGSCARAGILATMAILQGPGAEGFLRDQQAPHWIIR
jgi:thiamine biosynthesis lipoprotein